jgi:hypothetical protein
VFRVLGELTITPKAVTPRVTGRVAFVATEAGAPLAAVRWAVNGLTGGGPSVGTITADGLYTAPAVMPVPPVVTITATHDDDATLSASAIVTILPAFPLLLTAHTVSVAAAVPSLLMDRSVSAAVSVRADVPGGMTLGMSAAVSVAIEPVVLEVIPAVASPGETIALTITGRGLGGAISVAFLRDNGVVDPSVAVANISVNAEGTQATADIAVGATASAGPRVVQIATLARASSPSATGGNVFTVR